MTYTLILTPQAQKHLEEWRKVRSDKDSRKDCKVT